MLNELEADVGHDKKKTIISADSSTRRPIVASTNFRQM
jgi:hypothetical protein